MRSATRVLVVGVILLSGFALLPYVGWSAESFEWQRFVGAYEDVVTITRARYDVADRELEVRATSSDPGARLVVYDLTTRRVIGEMTHLGGGFYRLRRIWPRPPRAVAVFSSSGGRDWAPVERE